MPTSSLVFITLTFPRVYKWLQKRFGRATPWIAGGLGLAGAVGEGFGISWMLENFGLGGATVLAVIGLVLAHIILEWFHPNYSPRGSPWKTTAWILARNIVLHTIGFLPYFFLPFQFAVLIHPAYDLVIMALLKTRTLFFPAHSVTLSEINRLESKADNAFRLSVLLNLEKNQLEEAFVLTLQSLADIPPENITRDDIARAFKKYEKDIFKHQSRLRQILSALDLLNEKRWPFINHNQYATSDCSICTDVTPFLIKAFHKTGLAGPLNVRIHPVGIDYMSNSLFHEFILLDVKKGQGKETIAVDTTAAQMLLETETAIVIAPASLYISKIEELNHLRHKEGTEEYKQHNDNQTKASKQFDTLMAHIKDALPETPRVPSTKRLLKTGFTSLKIIFLMLAVSFLGGVLMAIINHAPRNNLKIVIIDAPHGWIPMSLGFSLILIGGVRMRSQNNDPLNLGDFPKDLQAWRRITEPADALPQFDDDVEDENDEISKSIFYRTLVEGLLELNDEVRVTPADIFQHFTDSDEDRPFLTIDEIEALMLKNGWARDFDDHRKFYNPKYLYPMQPDAVKSDEKPTFSPLETKILNNLHLLSRLQQIILKMRNGIGTESSEPYPHKHLAWLIGLSIGRIQQIERRALDIIDNKFPPSKSRHTPVEDHLDVFLVEILGLLPTIVADRSLPNPQFERYLTEEKKKIVDIDRGLKWLSQKLGGLPAQRLVGEGLHFRLSLEQWALLSALAGITEFLGTPALNAEIARQKMYLTDRDKENELHDRLTAALVVLSENRTGRERLAEKTGLPLNKIIPANLAQLKPEERDVLTKEYGIGQHRVPQANRALLRKVENKLIKIVKEKSTQKRRFLPKVMQAVMAENPWIRLEAETRLTEEQWHNPQSEKMWMLSPFERRFLELYYGLGDQPPLSIPEIVHQLSTAEHPVSDNKLFILKVTLMKRLTAYGNGWEWLADMSKINEETLRFLAPMLPSNDFAGLDSRFGLTKQRVDLPKHSQSRALLNKLKRANKSRDGFATLAAFAVSLGAVASLAPAANSAIGIDMFPVWSQIILWLLAALPVVAMFVQFAAPSRENEDEVGLKGIGEARAFLPQFILAAEAFRRENALSPNFSRLAIWNKTKLNGESFKINFDEAVTLVDGMTILPVWFKDKWVYFYYKNMGEPIQNADDPRLGLHALCHLDNWVGENWPHTRGFYWNEQGITALLTTRERMEMTAWLEPKNRSHEALWIDLSDFSIGTLARVVMIRKLGIPVMINTTIDPYNNSTVEDYIASVRSCIKLVGANDQDIRGVSIYIEHLAQAYDLKTGKPQNNGYTSLSPPLSGLLEFNENISLERVAKYAPQAPVGSDPWSVVRLESGFVREASSSRSIFPIPVNLRDLNELQKSSQNKFLLQDDVGNLRSNPQHGSRLSLHIQIRSGRVAGELLAMGENVAPAANHATFPLRAALTHVPISWTPEAPGYNDGRPRPMFTKVEEAIAGARQTALKAMEALNKGFSKERRLHDAVVIIELNQNEDGTLTFYVLDIDPYPRGFGLANEFKSTFKKRDRKGFITLAALSVPFGAFGMLTPVFNAAAEQTLFPWWVQMGAWILAGISAGAMLYSGMHRKIDVDVPQLLQGHLAADVQKLDPKDAAGAVKIDNKPFLHLNRFFRFPALLKLNIKGIRILIKRNFHMFFSLADLRVPRVNNRHVTAPPHRHEGGSTTKVYHTRKGVFTLAALSIPFGMIGMLAPIFNAAEGQTLFPWWAQAGVWGAVALTLTLWLLNTKNKFSVINRRAQFLKSVQTQKTGNPNLIVNVITEDGEVPHEDITKAQLPKNNYLGFNQTISRSDRDNGTMSVSRVSQFQNLVPREHAVRRTRIKQGINQNGSGKSRNLDIREDNGVVLRGQMEAHQSAEYVPGGRVGPENVKYKANRGSDFMTNLWNLSGSLWWNFTTPNLRSRSVYRKPIHSPLYFFFAVSNFIISSPHVRDRRHEGGLTAKVYHKVIHDLATQPTKLGIGIKEIILDPFKDAHVSVDERKRQIQIIELSDASSAPELIATARAWKNGTQEGEKREVIFGVAPGFRLSRFLKREKNETWLFLTNYSVNAVLGEAGVERGQSVENVALFAMSHWADEPLPSYVVGAMIKRLLRIVQGRVQLIHTKVILAHETKKAA